LLDAEDGVDDDPEFKLQSAVNDSPGAGTDFKLETSTDFDKLDGVIVFEE
jgi:hypothetical protein